MHRAIAVLLTVMLAFASFASAAHAIPHGAMNDHLVDGGPSGDPALVAVPDEKAASCCAGEVQRSAPSCPMFLAVLPATTPTPRRVTGIAPFPTPDRAGSGLDPERILDPPRPMA